MPGAVQGVCDGRGLWEACQLLEGRSHAQDGCDVHLITPTRGMIQDHQMEAAETTNEPQLIRSWMTSGSRTRSGSAPGSGGQSENLYENQPEILHFMN
jgi:hypothetical protein